VIKILNRKKYKALPEELTKMLWAREMRRLSQKKL